MIVARGAQVLIVLAAVGAGALWVVVSGGLALAEPGPPVFVDEPSDVLAPVGARAELHWEARAGGEPSDIEMILQRSSDGGSSWTMGRTCASQPDTELACGFLLETRASDDGTIWRAVVHNAAGATASRSVRIIRCEGEGCSAARETPTIIRNATGGDSTATVSWSPPPDNSAVRGYLVTPYVGFRPMASQTFMSTDTTQRITGLDNGTTYRFRVQALQGERVSDFSKVTNPVTPTA